MAVWTECSESLTKMTNIWYSPVWFKQGSLVSSLLPGTCFEFAGFGIQKIKIKEVKINKNTIIIIIIIIILLLLLLSL